MGSSTAEAKLQLLNAFIFILFNIIYAGLYHIHITDKIGGPVLMFAIAGAALGAAVHESAQDQYDSGLGSFLPWRSIGFGSYSFRGF